LIVLVNNAIPRPDGEPLEEIQMNDPNQESCRIALRVWGDYACFTRPELKAERVSYPLMTPSAARGVLEAIYYEPQIAYFIHSIGVIRRGRWFSFRRNEVARVASIRAVGRAMDEGEFLEPIRAGGGSEHGTQRGMLALTDVEYLIEAELRLTSRARPPRDNLAKYARLVEGRARSGKCYHRPYLGCREFDAHFGWVDDPSSIEIAAAEWPVEDLGLMLYDIFDPALRTSGDPIRPEAVFFHARIENARLDCHPDRVRLKRNMGRTS
jgi:CRISPR-associated protein Cas5d